ncbi:hypothetical protein Pfo_011851 [Paulownia fortunei]|nr:hypothetical protein Pfo_011851 [Paulownia fortunei]
MATTGAAITPPPLSAEANPSALSPSPEEPQDLTPITNHPSNTPQSQNLETLPPAVPLPPLFINSIAELKDLSAAIAAFQQCYDDLHNHLDSIKAAILSKLAPETPHVTPLSPSSSPKPDVSEVSPKPDVSEVSPKPDVSEVSPKPDVSEVSPKPDLSEERVLKKQQEEQNPPKSELEGLCKMMCSRGIRKYLATNLSHLPKLREEVPKALKLAPNPPKLVLACLGKFFLQGSKAFTRNSPMIPAREASILILECFLLMMGMDITNGKDNGVLDIEKAVREEAETAALAWRKRLVFEGGVAKANQIDARGLLLFVACFGIPASFKREDIRDLVIAADAKEIMGVLQKSHVLMNKIPEIVEGMMKNKMEVDAVDIAYTFGLEERFNPQTVLISFLRESKESWKRPKKGSQGSAASLNEANKKQLAALKSISKCLERHKIDPAKLLPGWQINEKITTLEKDIADYDRKSGEKTVHKRKASETETSKKSETQEAKRSRYIGHVPQQQKAAGHVDSRRNLLSSGLPNHGNNYSASQSVVYGGPGAGLLPESMIRPGVGAGMLANHDGILSTVSYAGVHGGVLVDTAGQVMNRGTHPYVWHGDSAINERYAGQPSSAGLTSLYRASTSMEGFTGVPNASSVGLGSRGSDLYQFADSVVDSESYTSSVPRSVAAVPNAVPARYSSYLYQV